MTQQRTVYVVDDDKAMRDSLRWLLESAGIKVNTYDSADSFLNDYEPHLPGCALVDVRMPGMSGLELHDTMNQQRMCLPVIVITGHGDISTAVQAMKAGAFDFIEKPFDDQQLLQRINEAIKFDKAIRRQLVDLVEIQRRIDSLSPRELEAMNLVVEGQMNKQIATTMGVTEKTVESHRAAVMRKMGAGTVVELVRMALAANAAATRPLPRGSMQTLT